MANRIMDTIARYYSATHEQVLKITEALGEQQILWSPNRTTPPIAFHLWHLARWADYLQEIITNSASQIWEKEGLALHWGFRGIDLGFSETGLGMLADACVTLPFPPREVLMDYVRKAFAKAEQVVNNIQDAEFHHMVQDRHEVEWKEGEIGETILDWLKHDNRHLGMIESLLGFQGMHGSATR